MQCFLTRARMVKLNHEPDLREVWMKKYMAAVLFCLIPFITWGQSPEVNPEQIITLVFSSNLYGEYEPCG